MTTQELTTRFRVEKKPYQCMMMHQRPLAGRQIVRAEVKGSKGKLLQVSTVWQWGLTRLDEKMGDLSAKSTRLAAE